MRDATRLLYLLNTKATRLRIPPDGMELMKWSEKILKRYLASQVAFACFCGYIFSNKTSLP